LDDHEHDALDVLGFDVLDACDVEEGVLVVHMRCLPEPLVVQSRFDLFEERGQPAVICGVLLMLLVTGTTPDVQSFMGAIMAIGISVANTRSPTLDPNDPTSAHYDKRT
jgi:hypothetical protein